MAAASQCNESNENNTRDNSGSLSKLAWQLKKQRKEVVDTSIYPYRTTHPSGGTIAFIVPDEGR